MGLCLCVLEPAASDDDEPDEIAECDVGHYSDFGCFRDTIAPIGWQSGSQTRGFPYFLGLMVTRHAAAVAAFGVGGR